MYKLIGALCLACSLTTLVAQKDGYVTDAPTPTEFKVEMTGIVVNDLDFTFYLPDAQKLKWVLYGENGERIWTKRLGKKGPGVYQHHFNMINAPNETYTVEIIHGDKIEKATFRKFL